MVMYIDLIMIENFVMNYIILYTTGKILNKKIYKRRIIIASLAGSLYVFSLCFKLPDVILNLSKIVFGVLMVSIGFRNRNIKLLINTVLVYFFVSFVYAGCTLAFVHIAKPKVVYIVNGVIIGGKYIFEIVGISSIVCFILTRASISFIKLKQKLIKKEIVCNIEILLGEKSVRLKALLDTGNLLEDPISKNPVIIVYKDKVKCLFDENYFKLLDTLIGGDDIPREIINDKKLKFIPYVSVGKNDGIMTAYVVDKIKVEYQDEINEINDVLIGFYNEALSKDDKYSALIGLQILEGSKINNEHIKNAKGKGKYSIC